MAASAAHSPGAEATGDAERRAHPDDGGRREVVHTFFATFMQDHARAEKADAADDALDGTAGGRRVREPDMRIRADER